MLESHERNATSGDRRVFVFRVDYQGENEFIQQELRDGRLRQGWGPAPLSDASSVRGYSPSSFVEAMTKVWPETKEAEALARYGILYPMLEMKPGDLVVVPKFPDPYGRRFVIVEVAGSYRFDPTDFGDYGHYIPIDKSTVREIGYDDGLDAKRVSGKFTSYRRAINNVWNEAFITAVSGLWNAAPRPEPTESSDWSHEVRADALGHMQQLLVDLPPRAIEELVTSAFVQAGYDVVRRNHYDGLGGDADLVLSTNLPLLSEAYGADLKVFVQVKKRNGVDHGAVQGLEQLERIAADEPMALKVLFSTAQSVSEEAEQVAQEKGIVIIVGEMAAAFLARGLLARAT